MSETEYSWRPGEQELLDFFSDISSSYSQKFQKFPRKFVYHYTDLNGLLGILESKSIFATNIKYLNDESEYIEVYNSLRSACDYFLQNKNCDNKMQSFFQSVKGILDDDNVPRFTEPYLTSFTALDDGLSQWRGYANNAGIQIGFSVSDIKKIVKLNEAVIFQCSYDQRITNSFCAALLAPLFSILEGNPLKGITRQQLIEEEYIMRMIDFFVESIAPIFKNSAFAEEKEYRIVKNVHVREVDPLSFRARGSLLVPYINLSVIDEKKEWNFSHIKIGPGPYQNQNKEAIIRLCRKHKVDVEVSVSEIPYRSI